MRFFERRRKALEKRFREGRYDKKPFLGFGAPCGDNPKTKDNKHRRCQNRRQKTKTSFRTCKRQCFLRLPEFGGRKGSRSNLADILEHYPANADPFSRPAWHREMSGQPNELPVLICARFRQVHHRFGGSVLSPATLARSRYRGVCAPTTKTGTRLFSRGRNSLLRRSVGQR